MWTTTDSVDSADDHPHRLPYDREWAARATGLIADLECLAAMDPDLTRWPIIPTISLRSRSR